MRHAVVLACALAASAPAPAFADQPPAPLRADQDAFPGSLAGPASAVSAGLAFADRWLADAPFDNPAVPPRPMLAVTPALQRMSRQDLRAENRDFDEKALFIDGAGMWGGAPAFGVMWTGYASQPVVRLENRAFVRGRLDSPEPPAVIAGTTTARELRAGVGASAGLGAARVGVAGEWTHREDAYDEVEQSGSPDAGERRAEFSADGFGFAAGLRVDFGDGSPGSVAAGAAARFVPELEVSGTQTFTLISGNSQTPIAALRESGWEGGISGGVVVTPACRVIAGVGGRTAQEWQGFGVRSGTEFSWSLATALRDPEAPWTLRIGLGQEQQSGVPEPRAGVVGLGFGWQYETWALDLAVVRRSIERSGLPTSFDDRILATYAIHF